MALESERSVATRAESTSAPSASVRVSKARRPNVVKARKNATLHAR